MQHYSLKDYYHIESVWNHENFWVNIRMRDSGLLLGQNSPAVSLELTDSSGWLAFKGEEGVYLLFTSCRPSSNAVRAYFIVSVMAHQR